MGIRQCVMTVWLKLLRFLGRDGLCYICESTVDAHRLIATDGDILCARCYADELREIADHS